MLALVGILIAAPPSDLIAAQLLVRTATVVSPHRVLVLPAITTGDLDKPRVAAFAESFIEAAQATFEWRRWEVVLGEEACRNPACADEAAARVGATYWLSSRIERASERTCSAVTVLYDARARKTSRKLEKEIVPCASDAILAAGSDLGREVAEGPQLAQRLALDLTPSEVRTIEIADLPEVESVRSSSVSLLTSPDERERALRVYRERHLVAVHEGLDRLYVVRDGEILGDCEVYRAARYEISPAMEKQCEGNLWEWAWAGLPLGAVLILVGPDGLLQGQPETPLPIALGVLTALAGPILALTLDADPPDLEAGEHVVSEEVLLEAVAKHNTVLRRALQLTTTDVEIAGMLP